MRDVPLCWTARLWLSTKRWHQFSTYIFKCLQPLQLVCTGQPRSMTIQHPYFHRITVWNSQYFFLLQCVTRIEFSFLTWHNVLTTSLGPFDNLISSFRSKMSRLLTLTIQIIAVLLTTLRLPLTIRCTQYGSKCNRKQQKSCRHCHFAQLICQSILKLIIFTSVDWELANGNNRRTHFSQSVIW